ncbi:MAG: hypothetical protein H0T79_08180 [Deltaproteobacteria bacterium]|nr:hypothetical protein [Deltaproteobacteria bacterium]
MKKKLPVVASKPTPADAQVAANLSTKPMTEASRPEFPTRGDLYRRAGLLGGTLLAGLGATTACSSTKPPISAPAPAAERTEADAPPVAAPTPVESEPVAANPEAPVTPVTPVTPVVEPVAIAAKDGSINGTPIDLKVTPKFKVYREGGGIGPAEDMWEPSEVEAFISWTLAKEGKLNLKTAVKFEHDGASFTLDGYDADKKIGYAYVDKLDSEPTLSKADRGKLEAWMKAKKVAILFIDMKKTPDQATLKGKIVKFVADVKKAPPAPGPL